MAAPEWIESIPAEQRARLSDASASEWIAPMLATLTDQRFSSGDWIYERKLDGVRCIAYCNGGDVALFSRNHNRMNGTYPEAVDALAAQRSQPFVADGEIVAFRGRHTSFAKLQGRLGLSDPDAARASGIRIFYYLFDLLHFDGYRLTRLPLVTRKKLLRRLIDFDDPLRFSPHRVGDGEAYYGDACRRQWEGVIAKRAAGTYASGRSRDWLKFKCVQEQEFVIGGYTDPKGHRQGFGALLLGYYDGAKLRYAGMVGTGFDNRQLRRLTDQLTAREQNRPAFADPPRERGVHWVRPELVAEVIFSEWTDDGKLRHPRFEGLREDKPPRQVVRERAA